MNNMKIVIILLLTMNIFLGVASAVPYMDWSSTFEEGIGVNSVVVNSDGGYLLTIVPNLSSKSDASLLKTDKFGIKEWYRIAEQSKESLATSAKVLSVKGLPYSYIMTGYSRKSGGDLGAIYGWLIFTDVTFKNLRKNIVTEPGNSKLLSVIYDDGKFVAVGNYGIDELLLVKMDIVNTIWVRKIPLSTAVKVLKYKDGGYIVGANPPALIKFDIYGNQEWKKNLIIYDISEIKDIEPTKDGGYIIVGNNKLGNGVLLKTDSSGDRQWHKIFRVGSAFLLSNEFNSVKQTKDGGFIVGGVSKYGSKSPMSYSGILIKTDSLGNNKWFIQLGDMINSVELSSDDGYIVAGSYNSKAWLAKVVDQPLEFWKKISDSGFSKEVLVGYNADTKKTNIYSVSNTGDVYKYNDRPLSWAGLIPMGSVSGKMFATRNSDIFRISFGTDSEIPNPTLWKVEVWNPTLYKWDIVGGSFDEIYGGGDNLIAQDKKNGIYIYKPELDTISKFPMIGGPGRTFAVGSNNNIIGISPNGDSIWKWNGVPNSWTQIGYPAKDIYAAGTKLFMTDLKGDIYKYDGVPFDWTKIGSPGKKFTVSVTDGTVYGLSQNGDSVWKWTGVPYKWEQVGGPAKDIIAGTEEDLFAINAQGEIWHYTPPRSWTTDPEN